MWNILTCGVKLPLRSLTVHFFFRRKKSWWCDQRLQWNRRSNIKGNVEECKKISYPLDSDTHSMFLFTVHHRETSKDETAHTNRTTCSTLVIPSKIYCSHCMSQWMEVPRKKSVFSDESIFDFLHGEFSRHSWLKVVIRNRDWSRRRGSQKF